MIKLQTQCDPKGCVSACIAMLLNRPVEEVTAEFHADYHAGVIKTRKYLEDHGVRLVAGDPEGGLDWDKMFLLGVPSLNLPGIMHQIIVTTFGDEFRVYDPNEGYAGRLFYSEVTEPGARHILGYRIDYEVLWCPAMGEDAA